MQILDKFIGAQYKRPAGLLGRYAGQRMIEQHTPENDWTLKLLAAQPQDRILEIGFGGGYAISALSKQVTAGLVAGLDYSATMVAMARQHNAAMVRQGRVDLRHGEASALPFDNGAFNKAYSIHSIYFWPQAQTALCELWRVLKPGGLLVLTVLPKERFRMQDPAELETDTFKAYSGIALQAMLLEAGFAQTRIEDGNSAEHLSNYSVIGVK